MSRDPLVLEAADFGITASQLLVSLGVAAVICQLESPQEDLIARLKDMSEETSSSPLRAVLDAAKALTPRMFCLQIFRVEANFRIAGWTKFLSQWSGIESDVVSTLFGISTGVGAEANLFSVIKGLVILFAIVEFSDNETFSVLDLVFTRDYYLESSPALTSLAGAANLSDSIEFVSAPEDFDSKIAAAFAKLLTQLQLPSVAPVITAPAVRTASKAAVKAPAPRIVTVSHLSANEPLFSPQDDEEFDHEDDHDDNASLISRSTNRSLDGSLKNLSVGSSDVKGPALVAAMDLFNYGNASRSVPFEFQPVNIYVALLYSVDGLPLASGNRFVTMVTVNTKKFARLPFSFSTIQSPPGLTPSVLHGHTTMTYPQSGPQLIEYLKEEVNLITKYGRLAPKTDDEDELDFRRDVPTSFATFQHLVTDYVEMYVTPNSHVTQFAILWSFVLSTLNSSFLWSDASVLNGDIESLFLFQVRHRLARDPTVRDLAEAALFLGYRCAFCGSHGSLPGACVRLCSASLSSGPSACSHFGPTADEILAHAISNDDFMLLAKAHAKADQPTPAQFAAFKASAPAWRNHVSPREFARGKSGVKSVPDTMTFEGRLRLILKDQSCIPIPSARQL